MNPTLAGATLGILGLGAIGVEVARLAAGLGMRVIGTKRQPRAIPHVERVHPPAETDHVLGEADYLLVLRPSTAQTRGSIDKRALTRLKPTAWVLNFGRGDPVVDADLVAAVRDRRIAGAVLDVFTTEPLPLEHPFWTTPGIVVLPHVGGLNPERTGWSRRCGWRICGASWMDVRSCRSSTEPSDTDSDILGDRPSPGDAGAYRSGQVAARARDKFW